MFLTRGRMHQRMYLHTLDYHYAQSHYQTYSVVPWISYIMWLMYHSQYFLPFYKHTNKINQINGKFHPFPWFHPMVGSTKSHHITKHEKDSKLVGDQGMDGTTWRPTSPKWWGHVIKLPICCLVDAKWPFQFHPLKICCTFTFLQNNRPVQAYHMSFGK